MSDYFVIRTCIFIFAALALYTIILGAPSAYPTHSVIEVPQGATVSAVATLLQQKHAVAWAKIFSLAVRLEGRPIPAGPYLLSDRQNVLTLAYRFSHGQSDLQPVKVTIPEGTSVHQAATILKNTLGEFDADAFIAQGKGSEGYLFPDTYFFLPAANPEAVIQTMKDTFQKRTQSLQKDILAFGHSEADIIALASILEKEARQPQTRRIVAGILWKRIGLGMPLQVDAAFGYIFNKDTYSPTQADQQVDSPYNTYKHKGLPPGPIDNPGAEAIEDAVTPIATPYLYYVTDTEGNIYYAKTYQEHLLNIQKAR